MKLTPLIFGALGATASAESIGQRGYVSLNNALAAINDKFVGLDNIFNSVLSQLQAIEQSFKDAMAEASKEDSLSLSDTLYVASYLRNVTIQANSTLDTLEGAKDAIMASTKCKDVSNALAISWFFSVGFMGSIHKKVPAELEAFWNKTSAGLPGKLLEVEKTIICK